MKSCQNEHTSSLALELELVEVRVLPAIRGSDLEATSILRISGILLAVYLNLQDSIGSEDFITESADLDGETRCFWQIYGAAVMSSLLGIFACITYSKTWHSFNKLAVLAHT